MELNKMELLNIEGGAITASFVNALARGLNTLFELGRSFGTSIRRLYNNKICRL